MGEGSYRLRNDGSGVDRRLQRELDQAETVAPCQVPLRLPAKHGGNIEKDDPLDVGLHASAEE